MTRRLCIKCSCELPPVEESPRGRSRVCVACHLESARKAQESYRRRRGQKPGVKAEFDVTHQVCTKCVTRKPFTDFYPDSSCASGFATQCKECRRARRRENWQADHNGQRTKHQERLQARTLEEQEAFTASQHVYKLLRVFGITIEQYEGLWSSQGGVCRLCGESETYIHPKTDKVSRLAVDHCHTGPCGCGPKRGCPFCIRGLLCRGCNQILGKAEVKPLLAARFADYLKERPLAVIA